MALGHVVHTIGVVLVIVAFGLLLVTCIGAPAVNDIGLLKVILKNASDIRNSSVVFGPFGYCVLDVAPAQTDQDYCPRASIGYIPAQVMRTIGPATIWTTWTGHDLDLMTVAYILFPITLAFAFFAAVFAFCGVIGSVIAAFLCFMGFLCALAVIVVAFISLGDLMDHVQYHGFNSYYGIGMWTALAALILLFFAMIFLFFSCFSGLGRRRRDKQSYRHKNLSHEDSRSSNTFGHERDHERIGEKHHESGYAPTSVAGVPFRSASRQHRMKDTMREKSYDAGTVGQNNHNEGYAPAAAIGAVGAGAGHHRMKTSVRDTRGSEEPGLNRPASQNRSAEGAPVHDLADRNPPSYPNMQGGNSVTHHLPTTMTTTEAHPDGRGGYDTTMHTSQHDPTAVSRSNHGASRSVSGGANKSRYKEELQHSGQYDGDTAVGSGGFTGRYDGKIY